MERYVVAVAVILLMSAAARAPGFGARQAGAKRESYRRVIENAHWEIRVPRGESREVIYTNKEATHFSCEAVDVNRRSYHGLYCAMHEYLDSWQLVIEGKPIGIEDFYCSSVFPHVLIRHHLEKELSDETIDEEIFLPDHENGLVVSFSGPVNGACQLVPWFDMRYIWEVPTAEYRIFWEEKNNLLFVSRADKPFPKGRPQWVAITANVPLSFASNERSLAVRYRKDEARRAMGKTNPFSQGILEFYMPQKGTSSVVFAFGLGIDENEAAVQAARLLSDRDRLKAEKLARIEELVARTKIRTEDKRFEKAFRWARVSMDNLIMNQRGRGIYAGFHWFPTYWGRDSFICLPGACLVTGELETARDILLSFLAYQQRDPGSKHLGRFPNFVDISNLQYAGVDGTWWLVRSAWKYHLAAKDRRFLIDAFPAVSYAIEGAVEKGVDNAGFLTHGNGETWMDAGGEANPYSPRGNRAVEVQALFHHGLLVGSAMAREIASSLTDEESRALRLGVSGAEAVAALNETADRWEALAEKLRSSFRASFWNADEGYLYDHLNEDGSPDLQIRPNAILALWVSLDYPDVSGLVARGGRLVSDEWAKLLMDRARKTVILEHGVTSLDPRDPQFHPYHLNLDQYYYDEAYHNGDVWEWLTGPTVTCLLAVGEREAAQDLIAPLAREILYEACVGSLREIQDGKREAGKDEFGGATSQAWLLAEFIRVCLTEPELDMKMK